MGNKNAVANKNTVANTLLLQALLEGYAPFGDGIIASDEKKHLLPVEYKNTEVLVVSEVGDYNKVLDFMGKHFPQTITDDIVIQLNEETIHFTELNSDTDRLFCEGLIYKYDKSGSNVDVAGSSDSIRVSVSNDYGGVRTCILSSLEGHITIYKINDRFFMRTISVQRFQLLTSSLLKEQGDTYPVGREETFSYKQLQYLAWLAVFSSGTISLHTPRFGVPELTVTVDQQQLFNYRVQLNCAQNLPVRYRCSDRLDCYMDCAIAATIVEQAYKDKDIDREYPSLKLKRLLALYNDPMAQKDDYRSMPCIKLIKDDLTVTLVRFDNMKAILMMAKTPDWDCWMLSSANPTSSVCVNSDSMRSLLNKVFELLSDIEGGETYEDRIVNAVIEQLQSDGTIELSNHDKDLVRKSVDIIMSGAPVSSQAATIRRVEQYLKRRNVTE